MEKSTSRKRERDDERRFAAARERTARAASEGPTEPRRIVAPPPLPHPEPSTPAIVRPPEHPVPTREWAVGWIEQAMRALAQGQVVDVYDGGEIAVRMLAEADLAIVEEWARQSRPERGVVQLGRWCGGELERRRLEAESWVRMADNIGRLRPDLEPATWWWAPGPGIPPAPPGRSPGGVKRERAVAAGEEVAS